MAVYGAAGLGAAMAFDEAAKCLRGIGRSVRSRVSATALPVVGAAATAGLEYTVLWLEATATGIAASETTITPISAAQRKRRRLLTKTSTCHTF